MFTRLFAPLFAAEMAGLRQVLAGLFILLVAAALAALGVTFVFVAFYLWLATQFEAWIAALLVAATVFVAGAIMWIVGRARIRKRRRQRAALAEAMQAMRASKDDDGSARPGRDAMGIAASAAMLGVILGRYLTR